MRERTKEGCTSVEKNELVKKKKIKTS